MRNIIEINKDAIDSIFVELQDDDFVVLPEIGTDIVSIEIIYKAEYYFKYEEIEEPVSIFVDYMKEIWGEVIVDYDFEYVFHWNGDRKDGFGNEAPDSDLEIFNIKIEVKKKKDGFFKRAFKRLKKFNEYEN